MPSVVPTVVTCSGATRVTSASAARCAPGHRELGDAEVEHLRLPAAGHEDVRGLDVAVDDAAGMRGVEGVGDLDPELEHAVERQRPARDLVLQRAAVEQFHDDELLALVLADVVDRADVRVVERRGDARLAAEPFERLGVGGEIGGQELQRDLAAETNVLGAVDHAHAAGAEPLEDLVMADDGTNHGRRNCTAARPESPAPSS